MLPYYYTVCNYLLKNIFGVIKFNNNNAVVWIACPVDT